jgi:hypothetical protein
MQRAPGAQILAILLLMSSGVLLLVGCGGGSLNELPIGFINHTQHSDAELLAIWQAAQQSLAKQIDLNPLQQTLSGAPASTSPGDPRAISSQPRQILVSAEPDVSSAVLSAATSVQRPDPTGLIACPVPCNVRYAAAYSTFDQPVTMYAASWEQQPDNFSAILQYEFENHILHALGYDMRWRWELPGYFFSAFLPSVFGLLSFLEDESPDDDESLEDESLGEDSLDEESLEDEPLDDPSLLDESLDADSPSDDEPEDDPVADLLG